MRVKSTPETHRARHARLAPADPGSRWGPGGNSSLGQSPNPGGSNCGRGGESGLTLTPCSTPIRWVDAFVNGHCDASDDATYVPNTVNQASIQQIRSIELWLSRLRGAQHADTHLRRLPESESEIEGSHWKVEPVRPDTDPEGRRADIQFLDNLGMGRSALAPSAEVLIHSDFMEC